MLTNEQDLEVTEGEWRSYSLYGLTLLTDFPFARRLAAGSGLPDLTFTTVTASPLPGALEGAEHIYASPPDEVSGEIDFHMYRAKGCLILSWDPAFDFYLWPDRIVCHVLDPQRSRTVEMVLLSVVFACWLEWHGVPALHASAVVVDGGAAAFVALPGSGKSSIASALMQDGHPLLSDDLLAIERSGGEYLGRPSYPQVRMWPDLAYRMLGSGYKDLEIVMPGYPKRRVPVGQEGGFGSFCGEPRPLRCLYLPERRNPVDWGTRVSIKPVSRREELITLIEHTFVVGIVEALGMHAQRLGYFSGMVSRVPMRRIVYPNGPEYLPRVRQAVLEDLRNGPIPGTDS